MIVVLCDNTECIYCVDGQCEVDILEIRHDDLNGRNGVSGCASFAYEGSENIVFSPVSDEYSLKPIQTLGGYLNASSN